MNSKFSKGDKVQVIQGVYIGKRGVVEAFGEGVLKSVGVTLPELPTIIIWFVPDEIEKVGE